MDELDDFPRDVYDDEPSVNGSQSQEMNASQQTETNASQQTPSSRKKTISNQVTLQVPKNVKTDCGFVLVEVSDPCMDLGGDTGVVGRVKCVDSNELVLDLKGSVYQGSLVPCNTMLVVSIGADSAKCEAIVGHYVPAVSIGSIFDTEVMTGTMAFDADEVDIDADVNVSQQTTTNAGEDEEKSRKRPRLK